MGVRVVSKTQKDIMTDGFQNGKFFVVENLAFWYPFVLVPVWLPLSRKSQRVKTQRATTSENFAEKCSQKIVQKISQKIEDITFWVSLDGAL